MKTRKKHSKSIMSNMHKKMKAGISLWNDNEYAAPAIVGLLTAGLFVYGMKIAGK